jgi:hypothetical protein
VPSLKLFCCGSVASTFISFWGVTLLNSGFKIVLYALSLSLLAASAVATYRPDWAMEAAAPTVD